MAFLSKAGKPALIRSRLKQKNADVEVVFQTARRCREDKYLSLCAPALVPSLESRDDALRNALVRSRRNITNP